MTNSPRLKNTERRHGRLLSVLLGIAAAVSCVLVTTTAPYAQSTDRDEQLVLTAVSGPTSYEYRVSRRRLSLTKPWPPDREPPLSVSSAVTVAKKVARLPEPTDFVLTAVQLRPFGLDNSGDWRWFYDVEFFNAREAFDNAPVIRKHVVVLMDGTVVDPTAMPGHP